MPAQDIVGAAVIAGIFMYLTSELGFRMGLSKSNLALIDGEFAIRSIRMQSNKLLAYLFGIPIHLFTSAIFGVVYFGIIKGLDLDAPSAQAIAPYVFCLYLAMLFNALPIAGQGILGRKIGRSTWVEQLVYHAVFGIGFWWALDVI
ncbi:MAG: hypothetical protein JSW38_04760 [Dehalococcoidia bacterium]|nr:MAG: hypothetical protein JSW38_04760 [Dehalococcoidia bacterium]